MKFYNRNNELETLERILVQSKDESRMTVIMGRRRIGKYWDRKEEYEIDLVAVNDIDGTAEVYEIKKDPHRYNEAHLQAKVEAMLQDCKELAHMQISLGVLSLEDM